MADLDPLIAHLRRRREDLGLSQATVARLAGVSIHAIADAECGRSGSTLNTLRGWTFALGLELDVREVS